MRIKWIIDNEFAVSSMPRREDLDLISRYFRTVGVLVEDHELEYDPEELVSRGVKVIRLPTPDMDAPHLLSMHLFLEEIYGSPKPVLVHCYGGIGRSGTIATAYVMLRNNIDFDDALRYTRSIDPRFVESYSQERILLLYNKLLRILPRSILNQLLRVGSEYRFGGDEIYGLRHVSKVLELSIDIYSQLKDLGLLELNYDMEKILYASAILHDVGKASDPLNHWEKGYETILSRGEEINELLGKGSAEKIAFLTRYHGDQRLQSDDWDEELIKALSILRVADGLDYSYEDEEVKQVIIGFVGGETIYFIVQGFRCYSDVERAKIKSDLLRDVLGKNIIFLNQCYG